MSSDPVIRVRDITKHYLMFERPEDRLKQMIVPRMQRLAGQAPKSYFRDFAALNGISFDVFRGETVGIIGRNGCGKSTLLQIVCGTLQPTSGTVEVNGRIAALLELGAGFNPEFTGRENVFMNAAILGLSRAETEARFDDIARFADIGMFIDQPVKTYSSGMYVRLAFAVAINVDPDILVVDEALAVGDEAFQRKCFARIEDIKDRGGTILFVSHGAQTIVQLCDRAMLIDCGEKILEGRPKTVVSQYQRLLHAPAEKAEAIRSSIVAGSTVLTQSRVPDDDASMESRASADVGIRAFLARDLTSQSTVTYAPDGAEIRDVRITTESGEPVNNLVRGDCYVLRYKVMFFERVEQVRFACLLKTTTGIELSGQVSNRERSGVSASEGDVVDVSFFFTAHLTAATYFFNAGVFSDSKGEFRQLHRIVDALMFRVLPKDAEDYSFGIADLRAKPCLLSFEAAQ